MPLEVAVLVKVMFWVLKCSFTKALNENEYVRLFDILLAMFGLTELLEILLQAVELG